MSLSPLSMLGSAGFADTLSVMLFGVPVTDGAVSEEYLDDLDFSDIISVNSETGFFRNHLALILDPELGVIKKHSLLLSEGLKAVGWCAPVDIYIVSSFLPSAADIISECERLEKREEILAAVPLTASYLSEQLTPDDPFDPDSDLVWDDLSPAGANWWLEAVKARQAWDYSKWMSNVKVGVIDSGVYLDHPEIKGKISFTDNRQKSRNIPSDHGTHVPGIIAAEQNNSIGVAGIVPDASIIYTDWSNEKGQLWITDFAIIFGLVNEVKAGAKAVNLSVGRSGSIKSGKSELMFFNKIYDRIVFSYVIASLLSQGYEFLLVESAGNGNTDSVRVDAQNNGLFAQIFEGSVFTGLHKISKSDIINHIILVGAAGNLGGGKYEQADFSNIGPYVEIAAPGRRVYSCGYTEEYRYMSGTSMAAPIVTAVASLVWSINPSFTGEEVKNIITSSTDAVAAANTEAENLASSEPADVPMVNAKLSVEKALELTYGGFTRISGTVPEASNGKALYGGDEYTVLSDGSYDFIAVDGLELTLISADGETVYPESGDSGETEPADTPVNDDDGETYDNAGVPDDLEQPIISALNF